MQKSTSAFSGPICALPQNTSGISAIIDKNGSLLQYSGIQTREIVYGDLPLYQEKTVYGFIGDVIPMVCILYLIGIFGYGIIKKYRK